MTVHSERTKTMAHSQRFKRGNNMCQALKPLLLVLVATAFAGCDSGGSSSSGNASALTANTASPCYERIQESLSAYGTPDEIREDSITFDDGSMMLIEEHVYSETRLVRSFGYKVADSACTTWEEGLTI
jgi:hypothetical protein